MKQILCCLIGIFVLTSAVGCTSDSNTPSLLSGNYYAVGDYEEMLTPYLYLDTEKNEFRFGTGLVVSYAEYGTYEVVDGTLIATARSTTFQFEIKDQNTLILIDNGDNEYFKIPVNTEFVFSEELK